VTLVLYAGFGICLASGLLHGAIGLRRPRARRHISFALAMMFLSLFLLGQSRADAARGAEEVVAIERWQFCFSAGLIASLAWFAREYTGVRLPRPLLALFYATLALFVVGDLTAPFGGFLGSRPELSTVRFGGEQLTVYSTTLGILQISWLSFSALFIVGVITMGVLLLRRGDRRRGVVFVAAFGMMALAPIADVLNGPVATRPPVGGLGVLILAFIMSIELAIDFRDNQAALAKAFVELQERADKISGMLETSRALRDQLNTPLQTLELDMTVIAESEPQLAPRVARMRRALDRLTELGRRLQGKPPESL
jgi:hypothetical protein